VIGCSWLAVRSKQNGLKMLRNGPKMLFLFLLVGEKKPG
jgi:hypothetical protein